SPMERSRVVVVVDTGIDAAGDAGDQVQPLGCIKSKERAGVIERDSEIENVAVRIKRVGAGIDCFRSFEGNELAEFQIDAALGHDGKMEAYVDLGNVRLIKTVSHRVIKQPERVDVTRIGPKEELQL